MIWLKALTISLAVLMTSLGSSKASLGSLKINLRSFKASLGPQSLLTKNITSYKGQPNCSNNDVRTDTVIVNVRVFPPLYSRDNVHSLLFLRMYSLNIYLKEDSVIYCVRQLCGKNIPKEYSLCIQQTISPVSSINAKSECVTIPPLRQRPT